MNNNQSNGSTVNANNKRNMIISGAVIIVVLAALIAAPRIKDKEVEAPVTEEVEEVATTAEVNRPSTTPGSRAEATALYAGKMIQFSGACSASPEALTVAPGTTVMLDNDTEARETITVGAKTYSVGAHRYTLTWMNGGPGEYAVTCGGKEVANIIVQ